jgi:hypothetical protein
MSSALMMERSGIGMPGLGVPGMSASPMSTPAGGPVSASYLMVPRCTIKLEKCSGGLKLTCICEDKVSSSMVQNLCTMLQGGLCSCCCMLNGMVVSSCNLTMGLCKVEPTDQGVCITCTSGDAQCGQMIQACCEQISCLLDSGCTCCVLMNNTPICCGCSESHKSGSKSPSKKA